MVKVEGAMFNRNLLLIIGVWSAITSTSQCEEKKEPVPKTLDAFHFTIMQKPLGPAFSLTVGKDGKVHYSYQSEPATGSGGKVVIKDWKLSEKEHQALLKGLVEDGIFNLENTDKETFSDYRITTTVGREEKTIHPKTFPEKLLKRIKPLLQHAHPEEWGKAEK